MGKNKKKRKGKKHIIPEKGRPAQIIIGAYGDVDNCTGIVEDKIFPDEGGIYVKLIGCSYLYKGFPNMQIVRALEVPKNMLSEIPIIIHDMPNRIKVVFGIAFLITRLIAKKFLIRLAEIYIKMAFDPMTKIKLDPHRYSFPIKEISRVLDMMIGEFKDKTIKKISSQIQYLLCMALEFDSAYKTLIQDIVPMFNIEALKKNPIRETKRVFDIFIERHNRPGQKIRWTKVKKIAILGMRLSPKVKKLFVRFISELNMEKIKRDSADWFYTLKRVKYNYGGISFEERGKIRDRINEQQGHKIPNVIVKEMPKGGIEQVKKEHNEKGIPAK